MSIESAVTFIERMKTDAKFAKKIIDCKDAEGRNELVKDEGFDFTPEELKSAQEELSSDGYLDLAAGGGYGYLANCYSKGCDYPEVY